MPIDSKKKTEELHFLNSFLDLYSFKNSKIEVIVTEKPDFILEIDRYRIGVELTKLMHKDRRHSKDQDLPIAHEKIADQIVEKASKLFKKISDEKLMVDVVFRSDYGLRPSIQDNPFYLHKKDIPRLSSVISELVNQYKPAFNSSFSSNDLLSNINPFVHEYKWPLPFEISGFYIDNNGHELWQATDGGYVPSLLGMDLKDSVTAKQAKAQKYDQTRYNEIWLLVVYNHGLYPTWYSDDHLEDSLIPINPYSKAIAFNYRDQKIITL